MRAITLFFLSFGFNRTLKELKYEKILQRYNDLVKL